MSNSRFMNEYMCKPNIRQSVYTFKEATEKRVVELEAKKSLTRSERYELEMCKADIRKADKLLEEK